MKLIIKFKDGSLKELESSDNVYIRYERKFGYIEVTLRDLGSIDLFTEERTEEIVSNVTDIEMSVATSRKTIMSFRSPKEVVHRFRYGTLDLKQDTEEFTFILGV